MNVAHSAEALETLEFSAVLDAVAGRARGPLASERLRNRTPTTDLQQIRLELARVGELLAMRRRGERLEVPPVPDLRGVLGRIRMEGSVLDLAEMVDVRTTLIAGRIISSELERTALATPQLSLLKCESPPVALERRLVRSIGDSGELLDAASPALAAARREVHTARERLLRKLEQILRDLDSGAAGAVTIREGRYVIPVRRDARNRPDGIIHDESSSAGTLFIEPTAAIDLGNAARAAALAEERAVLAVLRELTEMLRPHHQEIVNLHVMAVEVDTVQARAEWAFDLNGEIPEVSLTGGPLILNDARHPLLLERGVAVVPFDLTLSDGERTLLISGPNTGGKTVLLKAAGLVIALVQSGIVPPVGVGSAVPMVTRWFVDIGDHQSLQADLSTFSAHVAEIRRILEHADSGSMVILDEVGSGTDPAEGGALAAAVLETLTRRGVLTLATTHLGSLKSLATTVPGVVNGSLQFDAATLSPTYRFTKGIPGRSYGLAIARRLGVDPAVLQAAEAMVPDAARELDRLLAAVEEREQELVTREVAAAQTAIELDEVQTRTSALRLQLAERDRELKQREKEAEREMRRQAKAYLLAARAEVEKALGMARGAADEASAREARRMVEQAVSREASALGEPLRPSASGSTELLVGSSVRLNTGSSGEVLELRGDGRVVVRVGTMRLVVRADSLEALAIGERPQRERQVELPRGDEPVREAPTEIDLRGQRADEAQLEVQAALDAAVLADQPQLRIIHGMGTGVLRDVVRQLLERDPRVASFDFAPRQQGGTGVTIVVLR